MKNTTSWTLGIIILVILVIGFALKPAKTTSVKVVALYPLTGGVASWGEASQKATEIAVDEINQNGGIDGKKLEVVYVDHKCDAKVAISAFQQYSSQTKIFTSSSCSGTVLSLAPMMQGNDSLLLATVVASAKISSVSPFVFRNWSVENRQAALVGQKIKDLNLKKVGVIYEETDYGKGLVLALEQFLQGTDVVILTESFTTGATDVRTQLTKLKASNPDALFVSPQTETSSEVILSEMEQLSFKPRLFVNDIIFGAPNLISKHSKTLEGALGGNYVVQSDKLQTFLDAYKARFGTDCPHTGACAVAYDSINMLANAIKMNGDTAQAVKKYLQTVNYSGLSGEISFDSNNDRSGVGYSLSTITDGNVVLVK